MEAKVFVEGISITINMLEVLDLIVVMGSNNLYRLLKSKQNLLQFQETMVKSCHSLPTIEKVPWFIELNFLMELGWDKNSKASIAHDVGILWPKLPFRLFYNIFLSCGVLISLLCKIHLSVTLPHYWQAVIYLSVCFMKNSLIRLRCV